MRFDTNADDHRPNNRTSINNASEPLGNGGSSSSVVCMIDSEASAALQRRVESVRRKTRIGKTRRTDSRHVAYSFEAVYYIHNYHLIMVSWEPPEQLRLQPATTPPPPPSIWLATTTATAGSTLRCKPSSNERSKSILYSIPCDGVMWSLWSKLIKLIESSSSSPVQY